MTNRLHAVARSAAFRLVITDHAGKQMKERDVTRFEVEKILQAGAVVMVETDTKGRERWRVAGRDADGRRATDRASGGADAAKSGGFGNGRAH